MTEREPPTSELPVGAALLYCEACGEETPHRILRLRTAGSGGPVAGLARCRTCRWTHRFLSSPPSTDGIEVVLSLGPRSERRRLAVAKDTTIEVGGVLPGPDGQVKVTRIDLRGGGSPKRAPSRAVRTVWAVADRGPTVRIAIQEGGRTRSQRVALAPTTRLEVGGRLEVEGAPLELTALRARGRTWHEPGLVFLAKDVDVVYGRRTVSPPAGRRPWSRERETPRSRARSDSTRPRSRSSPGVSRNRRRPRPAKAGGGATAHRSSPS